MDGKTINPNVCNLCKQQFQTSALHHSTIHCVKLRSIKDIHFRSCHNELVEIFISTNEMHQIGFCKNFKYS